MEKGARSSASLIFCMVNPSPINCSVYTNERTLVCVFIVKYISDFIYTLVDERLHEVVKNMSVSSAKRNYFLLYSFKATNKSQKSIAGSIVI
jgi:hypothetical protein